MFNKLRKKHKKISTTLEIEDANLLFKKYPESRKMFEIIEHIKSRNPKIRKLFNRHPIELSKHDTKDLLRIIDLQNELLIRERDIFQIKGARKSIYYMKQIEESKNDNEERSK